MSYPPRTWPDDGQAALPPSAEIAILDARGFIVYVNQAWIDFCVDNGGNLDRAGVGTSYLEMCATAADDPAANRVAAAINAALAGELIPPMTVQIRCDSPDVPRSFDVMISSRFDRPGGRCVGAAVTLSRSKLTRELEMHELVGELTARAQEVLERQRRLLALVHLSAALPAEIGPEAVLARVATAARELTRARSCIVRHEADEPPVGRAELAIPIRVQGRVFAQLHLSAEGSSEFTDEDEELLTALAISAGVAIESGQLRTEVERRRRWQAASAEASQTLVAHSGEHPLDIVARFAAAGSGSDIAIVTTRADPVTVLATFGADTATMTQRMQVPLGSSAGTVIVVGRAAGREPFEAEDLDQLIMFAAHLAATGQLDRPTAN